MRIVALAVFVILPAMAGVARADLVTFEVEVPHCTPVGATVNLRSNRLSPGVIRHDPLTRIDRTRYSGTFDVAIDRSQFRYRYTHGICDETRCEGIEKDISYNGIGADVAERTIAPGVGSVTDLVYIWRDAVRTFDPSGAPTGVRETSQKVAFCGPFLSVSGEGGEITISYDAYDAGEVILEYGPTPAYGQRIERRGQHRNRFPLPGLVPGQRIHYRVVERGQPGPDHVFTAAPRPGEPFRFGFIGDTQYYEEADRLRVAKVVEQLVAFEPHLMVSPGDMVGSTRSGSGFLQPEMGRFNVFFGSAAQLMARSPFMVAMGNHEEDVDYFWDAFEFPKNDFPRIDHYWFRYGNIHFTMLYTGITEGYDMNGILDVQTPWLERVLSAASRDPDVRWKVIVLHRGPFSQGARHPTDGQAFYSNSNGSRRSWAEIWRENGVDLVLAGHNHNFTVAVHDGTRFVTSCGGAPGHELRMPDLTTTIYAEQTCSADLFEVGPRTISFRAIRPDGTQIDPGSFSLCKEASDCEELTNPCAPGASARWSCSVGACGHVCEEIPATLEVTPEIVSWSADLGGSDPAPVELQIQASRGTLPWTARCTPAFLSCDPLTGATPGSITVSGSIAGLGEGIHTGLVLLTVPGQSASATVTVELAIRAAVRPDAGFADAAIEDSGSPTDAGMKPTRPDAGGGPGKGTSCSCRVAARSNQVVWAPWLILAAALTRRLRAARRSSVG